MANTSPPNTQDGDGADKGRHGGSNIKDTARSDWEGAKAQARDDLNEVKREARNEFDEVRGAAGEFAEGQKNQAAEQMEGLASAIDRFGNELRSGEQAWAGRYAGDLAGRLENMAQRTRTSSVDDLVGDVERFGRERPGAFLAGAALLGLAASRFLTASAHRRSRTSGSRYYNGQNGSDDFATPNVQTSTTRNEGELS